MKNAETKGTQLFWRPTLLAIIGNGRVFLIDAFSGNELLADSVNHLLVGVVDWYRLKHRTKCLENGTLDPPPLPGSPARDVTEYDG